MADDAAKKGDADKAEEFTTAAETIANRLIALEREVEDLKALPPGQRPGRPTRPRPRSRRTARQLQKKLAERQKLLGQLDQAKMQEQMNKAMATLSETVGQDVPTFDEVRDKIEARYAKAKGMSELSEGIGRDPHARGRAGHPINTEAHARLDEIREQLGLAPASPSPPPRPAEEPPAEA